MLDTLDAVAAGIDPVRTDDPATAARLVSELGACVLTGLEPTRDCAAALARLVAGDRVVAAPTPIAVREGGDRDPKIRARGAHEVPLPLHTDGFSYGLEAPDLMFLLCERASAEGGESTVVDAYAVVDALARHPDGERVCRFMADVELDLTAPGASPRRGPLLSSTSRGRRQVIAPALRDHVGALAGDRLAAVHERCIDEVLALFESVRAWAPRVRLAPGEALCADNYRVLHSRGAYADLDRLFWRVWAWTDEGRPPPPGELASDVRYVT